MELNLWEQNRSTIRSRKGGWRIGKDVILHGRSLFNDLMGSESWFQVWLLSITGRHFERRIADFCENFWFCLSFPDPRIWCNQVCSLSGTMRCSPVAALAAGALTSDSLQYSAWAVSRAADFFLDIRRQQRISGFSLETFLATRPKDSTGCPKIPGYNRPVARGDERVAVLHRLQRKIEIPIGENLKLALELHDLIQTTHGEQMNAGGYGAAFLLDQGLSSAEIYQFLSMGIIVGAVACYVDAIGRAGESFLPMRCTDFEYKGTPSRPFPTRN